ncbi:MAG TPA: hypothetical protein VJ741_00325 [Solirubrobacteraceae bacterium]|nr:hypothetical protein [Solirubrobacteraceae bacterium]
MVEAGASGAPASSGIASGPSFWPVAAWAVDVVLALVLVAVVVVLVLALALAAGLCALELLLLPPHAASAQAAINDAM